MELFGNYLLMILETGGFFAPFIFIFLHLLRPLLFLPVVFMCISGGIIFGSVLGSAYSIIGITLSSCLFYVLIHRMPGTFSRLMRMKQKITGGRGDFTVSQIAVLRLVPFIHFHLLSLCLIRISADFKSYLRSSLITNIPLAVIYTTIGQWITKLTPFYIFILLITLLSLIIMLRRKETSINWHEFFQVST